ncbi:Flp family type IVb pilin [Novosphingobium sp.]|uniref:Flp family type IVb pilin n=1 Tax=Novosphingobium sp. TaxID=1874826 RepID=UPI003BABF9C6
MNADWGNRLMWDFVRKPLVDKTGATAIEYGLLIGVIAMTMFFGMTAFVNSLFIMYNTIDTNLTRAKK